MWICMPCYLKYSIFNSAFYVRWKFQQLALSHLGDYSCGVGAVSVHSTFTESTNKCWSLYDILLARSIHKSHPYSGGGDYIGWQVINSRGRDYGVTQGSVCHSWREYGQ